MKRAQSKASGETRGEQPVWYRAVATLTSVALVACMTGVPAGAIEQAWAADSPSGVPAIKAASPALGAESVDGDSSLQIEKSASGNGSAATGALGVGDKLYAHAYDYWDDDVITPEAGWQYQWLAGDSKSAATSTYTAIEGQTSQCLEITEALANELAGKYIRVRLVANGVTLEAPASSYNTPGPVEVEGKVKLGWAFVLDNASEVGSAYNISSVGSASAGDTLKAVTMKEGNASTALYSSDGVTFTWQASESADGTYADIATGDTLVLSQEQVGKYVRVAANAGLNTVNTTAVRVYAAGQTELQSVDISDPGTIQLPGAGEDPITLTATAYKGTNYSNRVAVTENVIYEWSYATSKDAADEQWTVVGGATGSTLQLDSSYAGRYVRVKATAGANTVTVRDSYIRGPFKTDGKLIYSAVLAVNGATGYNVAVGDTLSVVAYEQTDAGGRGDQIEASELTYRWQVADAGSNAFADIEGTTGTAATLTVAAEHQGKTIRCIVNARAGDAATRASNAVAAQGSVYVSAVSLAVGGVSTSSSDMIPLGSTIDATASNSDNANLNDNRAVTWSWYASDQKYASSVTEADKIDGATSSSFTVSDAAYIGKYIYAFANGGYGVQKSNASGRITGANAVELWSVAISGGTADTIGVGDVLTAVARKVKYNAGSSQGYQAALDIGDDVTYQWQYANTSTTADANFTDIEGATQVSYTIPSDMAGKYIRVKATSANTAVSTKSSTSDSAQTVSPKGPVQAVAGAVTLDSVKMVSSTANSMWVGATVTPTAQYYPKNSNILQPVPQNAKVTYTWKVADTQSGPYVAFDADTYPLSSVSASGELAIGADLQGKYVRVEANAQMNTVQSLSWLVLPQGVYDLLRITFGFNSLYTGETITTQLQGKTLDYENSASFGTNVPIDNANVTYQWYSTLDEPATTADGQDFSAATWTAIDGATGADLVIPEAVAGCYVKVVAISAKDGLSTSVERASTTRVQSRNSLSSAVSKLDETMFHPNPVYGEKTNVNKILSARLESLGFENVTVKTKAWSASVADEKAHLGISTQDDATNGDVTFFSYDDAINRSFHTFTSQRQVRITFELSRPGEEPVETALTASIPWDRQAASALVEAVVDDLVVGYSDGDSAESVTKNITLPCKVTHGDGSVWVTWSSSDPEALAVSDGVSWEDYTATPARGANDASVTLTATFEGKIVDTSDDSLSDLAITRDFPVVVKGDPEMIDDMNTALKNALDATFTESSLADFRTGAAVDADNVTADVQLPSKGALFSGSGLDSGDYKVEYLSDDERVFATHTPEGNALYRSYTYRPLPGSSAGVVRLTLSAKHAKFSDVKYTKVIELVVAPLSEAEIDADIAYMEQVKESIFDGYSEGLQDKNAVTSNLHPFQRAYFTPDGKLHWKYASSDKADKSCAIGFSRQTVADTTSSDASYSYFVTSHPGIIADSTLYVNRARLDVGVSITCCLSSDRFGAYYERYANDSACSDELKDKFRQLYRQKIPCQVIVKGTQVAAVERDALVAAADEAEALMEGVVASPDGKDVAEDATWAPQETMQALEDAIVAARATAARDSASEADVQKVQENLDNARAAFEAACKPGLSAYATAAQKKALADAADSAEALLANVYSSADGKDVDSTRSWAPFAAIDRVYAAIDAARAIAAMPSVAAGALNAASSELAASRVALEGAIKKGLKTSQKATGSSGGKSASTGTKSSTAGKVTKVAIVKAGKRYVAGSGASKAMYLVKKVATSAKAGTVWYVASKVAKKTGKAATVPATVKIKGGKYKVVRVSAGAFKNMKKLAKVTLGANVSKVAKGAFKNTPKLKTLVVKGKKLSKKASVKGAFSGSKAQKLTVKVTKSFKKKAKKVFTKKNLAAPKKVTVK